LPCQPPSVPTPLAEPHAIAFTTPTYCVSVGEWYGGGETTGGFGEIWKGQAWQIGYPGGQSNGLTLQSVSCGWFTTCMAVGYGLSTGPFPSGTTELWNGSVWTPETVADRGRSATPTFFYSSTRDSIDAFSKRRSIDDSVLVCSGSAVGDQARFIVRL
jgi:hypothetical protein